MDINKWIKENVIFCNEKIDCFGVTFCKGNNTEFKCYKNGKKKINNIDINSFFSTDNNITRCDYKISDKIRNDEKEINDFIRNNIKYKGEMHDFWNLLNLSEKYKNEFRLMEIGTRLSEKNNEQTLRGYFSLRKFQNDMDVKGEFCSFAEKKKMLKEIEDCLNISKKYMESISNNSEILEQYGYFPTMFGFQESSEMIEKKIYFELSEPDKHIGVLMSENLTMLRKMGISYIEEIFPQIKNVILNFWQYDYFLRGIAFATPKYPNNIRLYFSEVRRFIE